MLYLVSTPIGNLGDITLRAIEVLKEVDFVICEDTRMTMRLLNHLEIKKELISYHSHSKISRMDKIIDRLKKGETAAMVSDAGSPCISDPGNILISELTKNKIEIFPLPGATALIPAVQIAPFDTHQFVFLGFVPVKKGRQTLFREIADSTRAVVFYESTHRILKTLSQLGEVLGDDRQIFIGREMTKMYEEYISGSAAELLEHMAKNSTKGEFVLVVSAK